LPNKLISTATAAETLGTSERRVRQLAAELGVNQVGGVYLITERHLAKMQTRKTQRGPVKKEKK
jgi:hypothetical protein